jgi:phage tail-like protein
MADEPYRAFNFTLLIEGVESGQFVECAGLSAEVDVIAYREGGANQQIRHLPGQVRFQPLELRYGLSRSRELWDWFSQTLSGETERRNVSVVMFENDGHTEAFRWNLFEAWVSRWKAAQLNATVGEVAIDSMTIVYDRLERD